MNYQKMFFVTLVMCLALAVLLTISFPTLSRHLYFLPAPRPKMLIYLCPKNQGCGGWGDRQKGIVSVYLLALATNRRFGVILESPCDFKKFVVPNLYNWDIKTEEYKNLTKKYLGKNPISEHARKDDFNALYPEDVVFVGTNGDHCRDILANPYFQKNIPSWVRQPKTIFFEKAWNFLMKPSPKVQERLDSFFRKIRPHKKKLVGVHVRLGANPTIPFDGRKMNNISKLGPLWDHLKTYVKNGSHIFMATDSQEVRQIARKKFGLAVHDTNGTILHVAKQRKHSKACQGFEDAVLDQLILSKCDVLFINRMSGFSYRAAQLRNSNKNLFMQHHGKIWPTRV